MDVSQPIVMRNELRKWNPHPKSKKEKKNPGDADECNMSYSKMELVELNMATWLIILSINALSIKIANIQNLFSNT